MSSHSWSQYLSSKEQNQNRRWHKPNAASRCLSGNVSFDRSLPCALEGHNWEPEDRRPRPAAPAEGAAESPPNRSGSFPAGQKSAAVWVHGARLPHPHASDQPRAQASAAACTPRTRSPSSLPAAGFLSPPPTGLQWTRATWCPWGRHKNIFSMLCYSHLQLSW